MWIMCVFYSSYTSADYLFVNKLETVPVVAYAVASVNRCLSILSLFHSLSGNFIYLFFYMIRLQSLSPCDSSELLPRKRYRI